MQVSDINALESMRSASNYNKQLNICFYEWNLRHLFAKKENF